MSDLPRILVAKRHKDVRGWFSEIFHQKRLREVGITCPFVQDNVSYSNRKGILRGLHFQEPPAAQAKLVNVLRGKVLDVVVDVRAGSPTFGKYVSAELSDAGGEQIYVPVGFAHGFVTLDDDVLVTYKVSAHYDPAHDRGIRWDDPDLAFPWPAQDVVVSDKDGKLPLLREIRSPFGYDGNPLVALEVTELG